MKTATELLLAGFLLQVGTLICLLYLHQCSSSAKILKVYSYSVVQFPNPNNIDHECIWND